MVRPLCKLLTVFCFASQTILLNLVLGELQCRTSPNNTLGGTCAVHSNICCESYASPLCRNELLSGDGNFSAPRLRFYKQSLMFDPQRQLLCVRGVTLSNMTASVTSTREISGIYLEVQVFMADKISQAYFSSSSIIFPGYVSLQSLEKGLFCVDMRMSESRLTKQEKYLSVRMLTLPGQHDQVGVMYTTNDLETLVAAEKVQRVDLLIEDCREWIEKKPKKETEKAISESNVLATKYLKHAQNHAKPSQPKGTSETNGTKQVEQTTDRWICSIIVGVIGCVGLFAAAIIAFRSCRESNDSNEVAAEMLRRNTLVLPPWPITRPRVFDL